jgi:hypothetical protein
MKGRYYALSDTVRIARGNRKIGPDTLILNMDAAADCRAARAGLCQLDTVRRCYARKAEYMYPGVIEYRRCQSAYFHSKPAADICRDLDTLLSKPGLQDIRYLRFNESGDFRNQRDVNKLNAISTHLWIRFEIVVYGYTSRRDLDFTKTCFIVNGSGFMLDNEFRAVRAGSVPAGALKCPGACYGCDWCKAKRGQIIYNEYH